jgi:hypothetical protein
MLNFNLKHTNLKVIKKFNLNKNSCVSKIKQKIEAIGENININSQEMSQLAVSLLKMIETIKYKAS